MGVKLEILRMLLYLSFPVGVFWVSNQAGYFQRHVVQRKREIFPPDNPERRCDASAVAMLVTEGTRGRSTWLRRDAGDVLVTEGTWLHPRAIAVAALVTEGTRGHVLSPRPCPDAIAVAALVTEGTRGFVFTPSL